MAVITRTSGTLEYLVAEGISVPHGFTTRLGGVSTGYLASMNIGLHRGDDRNRVEENYRILSRAMGFDPEKLVLTKQIHSDIIRTVGREHWGQYLVEGASPVCDALITNDPGTVLTIFTADCTPILLQDPITGAVGAVHAGWRGTAMDIAGKTVARMVAEFGCDPKNIRAAIGPNIGPCCFQTDGEVPRALLQTYGTAAASFIGEKDGKFYPDLKQINALSLKNAGVARIEISQDCTMCQHEKYWSHRYTRGQRGSQGAMIVCKEANR